MSNDIFVPSFEEVQRKVEEYQTTIMALCALCRIVNEELQIGENHLDFHSSCGRKMDTSSNNRVHPNNTATPDLVIQKGDDWGMVVEAKRSMPKNENDRWRDTVDQLIKYDDTLKGWWTNNEQIPSANLALLVDSDRSIEFSRYLDSLITNKTIESFQNPTSIIEFYRKQEVNQFLHIRKIWGVVEPQEFTQKLETGKSINVEVLVDKQKFYDQEPEIVEYVMVLLWQNVFTELYRNSKFDDLTKVWLIEVDLDKLTEELQKLYGNKSNEPRERTYPRKKWIQKALDAFILLNLATHTSKKNVYEIKFKKLRGGDLFQRFYRHREIAAKKKTKTITIQPELFSKSEY